MVNEKTEKYILGVISGFFLFFGLFAAGYSLAGPTQASNDARAMSSLLQIHTVAELIKGDEGGYENVSCGYNSQMKMLCDDIGSTIGSRPIIYADSNAYCAYIALSAEKKYYCVDNAGHSIGTYVNPGETGYCTGKTFSCPSEEGKPPVSDNPSSLKPPSSGLIAIGITVLVIIIFSWMYIFRRD